MFFKVTATNAWMFLFVAGAFEISWVVCMKYSNGFSNLWPSVLTLILSVFSLICLSFAIKLIPVATAYAVWTGIGAIGIVVLSFIIFKEPVTLLRLLFILLILIGVVGLKFVESSGSNV
ncbi:MAG: multidrug efflux SMR transporter [Proteobacteria bacterium]|nr:multidrug efflux SMR transporter [Pseudomonadota bacterium]